MTESALAFVVSADALACSFLFFLSGFAGAWKSLGGGSGVLSLSSSLSGRSGEGSSARKHREVYATGDRAVVGAEVEPAAVECEIGAGKEIEELAVERSHAGDTASDSPSVSGRLV